MLRKLLHKTPLAWCQMTREKTRLTVALLGIAFADILMFIQLGFQNALYDAAVKPQQALEGDLFLINPQFDNLLLVKSFSRERLYQAAGFEGVESVTSLYIATGQWRNPINHKYRRLLVFGIDPANSAFRLPEVNQYLEELKMLNRVIYDQTGRKEFGPIAELLSQPVPLETELNNVVIQVVGLFSLGTSFAADGNVITSDSTFLRMFPQRQPEQIDVGVIKLKTGVDVEQVKVSLERSLPPDVMVLSREGFAEREKQYWASATPIGFIFGLGSLVGFIVGTVIVYQIIYSDVCDHLSEYATLKAMGYSDRYLIMIIVQESLILAILGFIPGLAVSCGLYQLAQVATRLPISINVSRIIFVLILTIIMCILSGSIAMRKLQAADPADVF